jgi:hypothetical protein
MYIESAAIGIKKKLLGMCHGPRIYQDPLLGQESPPIAWKHGNEHPTVESSG